MIFARLTAVAALGALGVLAGYAQPALQPVSLQDAATSVSAQLPWDSGSSGWESICSLRAPCDSIWVDARVSAIPGAAVVVILPGRLPVAGSLVRVPGILGDGHPTGLRPWEECGDAFAATPRPHIACVALGIVGQRSRPPDSLVFAIYMLAPATANAWSVARAVHDSAGWRATVLSHGTP
jgi:hypothetical protein